MTPRSDWRWWCGALLIGAVIIAGAFYLDATVHAWVRENQSRNLREFMLAVSRWGDWPSHMIAGAIAAVVAYAMGKQNGFRVFIAMLLACALAGAATRVVKISAGRARPSVTANAGWNGPSLSSKYHAFPSGHTASSTAFFAVPCFARRRLVLAFLPIPLLIATSRILLDAHHLSDVVAGAMLGVLCAFLAWRFVSVRYPASA